MKSFLIVVDEIYKKISDDGRVLGLEKAIQFCRISSIFKLNCMQITNKW